MNELVLLKNDEAVCDSLEMAESFIRGMTKLFELSKTTMRMSPILGRCLNRRGVHHFE